MPLSGMTGFGRAEGALGDWSWAVEARSVNGRNLEVRFRAPPGFDALEKPIREGGQARFQRGQVNVNVQARRAEGAGGATVNIAQLERYLEAMQPYVEAGKALPPSADGLLGLRGVVEAAEAEDDAEARAALEQAIAATIGQALDGLKAARLAEGAALTPVLAGLIDRIEALVAAAESEAAGHPLIIKERFAARMAELLAQHVGEERIAQEAAAMAVKADVREELDRLAGHVAAARTLMAGEGAAGRRLDFLTQEFMREANTLCSKSATSALTAIGLDLKAVIEQFREQVQNVE
ncbi:YicC/YloC family endoribonuclease [Caulobacter mirabilis]|uniref:YicC family protein n=1 Tax=Caulobacter mirabilis TaxID=69666 RepID=A0A2D2AZ11_9CAUL|nr:YicC/YloC family endoribonuclease [Caulobacter mirabilis]ATQ43250.1 YicC family protein [Caulobacter mirabilis]